MIGTFEMNAPPNTIISVCDESGFDKAIADWEFRFDPIIGPNQDNESIDYQGQWSEMR